VNVTHWAPNAAVTDEVRPLTVSERAFWLAFMRALMVVPRALDADLLAGPRMSATEYRVLMVLSESPERRLRMSELAASCDLSLSGMTRLVARLEGDGLVVRMQSECDARGFNAVLTDAGFARLEAAYPQHLASVRRNVIDHLNDFDLDRLAAAFNAFAEGQPACPAVQEGGC
jgi:DNA-binding MarR family transcriptional regulator